MAPVHYAKVVNVSKNAQPVNCWNFRILTALIAFITDCAYWGVVASSGNVFIHFKFSQRVVRDFFAWISLDENFRTS